MFGSLKEKLKSWVSKAKKDSEEPEKTKEKPTKSKKVKKKAPKKEQNKKLEKAIKKDKKQKEEPKLKRPVMKFSPGLQKYEPDIQSTEEIIEQEKPEQKEKKSLFSKFQKKLTTEKFNELFEELELILLQNNVAYEVVEKIKLSLEEKLVGKPFSQTNVNTALKDSIESILINPPDLIKEIKKSLAIKQPYVIAFVGINGSGKTTSIAKLTKYLQNNNFSCLLAAADTFRAASIEQLQKHADKLKVHLIKKDYGSDPASVGFDAISYAKKHHIDIVLIDTAGRMQNQESLMREIEKLARVNKPDMKIFVGESITGNDATEQAKAFNDSIIIDGIILSKADVDEKGGTSISVSYVTKKPILFLGTGQTYEDLEVFNKNRIVKQLGL